MIPVLYEKNETEFVTNGIGRLSEVVSCTVEEVLNGKYELQMQYPVGGKLYDNIKHSAIIYALPSDGAEEQPFRIYRISKPINGIVTIYAEHISYQLSHVTVSPYEAESIAGALNGIKINAADDCPFEFWTDKGTVADFSLSVPASGRSILGGMEGSVLDVYGGEYEFDRYKVKLHEHRGRDRGVSLRYGKNITDITQEENISNTITGVYPYWANTSGEYIELPEKVLYADNADNFPFRRTIPLDCSGDFQSAPTVAQLREKGIAYITKSGIGIPKVSIKVSFVALWQTEEYKDIALLERVKLGDTVSIEFETLNVSATAKVSKTVYDVLKERYEKIELGDAKTNLSKVVADQQKELNSKASGAYIKWAVDQATDLITGVDGGNVVIRRDANGKPYEILIMDTDDVNTAKHVWRWNKNGWGYSSDGYNGPFTLAATINGGIVADAITSGKIEARNSAGNVVFSVNVGTGEVYISGDVIRIGGKTLAQALEDSKALQVLISNEYQGIPTDSDGNYTTFPECSTAIQVLYGQTDITAQCTLTATTSTGVTAALTGTTLKVTALAADTGWVDIKATYLGTMTATKRFNLSKVKDGSQGSNVKILNTEISMTQEEIATNSAMGYVRNWTVITLTDGLKAGDNVMLQVYNDTKGGEAYILATVNEVLSEYRINTTSAGLLDKGEQGKDGTTARTYILEPSVTTIKRGQDNVPVPDEIAFSAYYRDGTSASRTAYAGRFKIEKSTDGNTWSTVYISSANETSCRYELYTAIEDGNGNYLEDGNGNVIVAWYDEDAVMFRGTLYAAGGTTSALDMQTVPVVIDVAALTHEQIFNLLTNNGAWQGIFYLNGKCT